MIPLSVPPSFLSILRGYPLPTNPMAELALFPGSGLDVDLPPRQPHSSHWDSCRAGQWGARLHLLPCLPLRARMLGRSQWTQAQDCSLDTKALECLKRTLCGRGNQVGKREVISKLHGFSLQRQDGGGAGKASTYLLAFISPLASLHVY